MNLFKIIPLKRIWQTLNLNIRVTSGSRAKWLKKHKVFKSMGEHVMLQIRKIPLYPQLISFGNNIIVASNVTFLTHDAIHQILSYKNKNMKFNEKIGCIDIRDNCFIGANSIIYSNVKIGPNAIIAAGSIVTKDVPEGTVVGGIPAKVIGSYEELISKRCEEACKEEKVIRIKSQEISNELIEKKWKKFYREKENKEL